MHFNHSPLGAPDTCATTALPLLNREQPLPASWRFVASQMTSALKHFLTEAVR